MKNIILIGAGGHAKVICDSAKLSGSKILGFVDAKTQEFEWLKKLEESQIKDGAIIAFGAVHPTELVRRQKVFESYKVKFATVIHPSAIVSDSAEIGAGSFVSAGVIINAGAKIGRNCIINSGAIIEHDAVIEDGCHIAPSSVVLGDVTIGRCTMVGAGAVVVQGTKIAAESFVKANKVVK